MPHTKALITCPFPTQSHISFLLCFLLFFLTINQEKVFFFLVLTRKKYIFLLNCKDSGRLAQIYRKIVYQRKVRQTSLNFNFFGWWGEGGSLNLFKPAIFRFLTIFDIFKGTHEYFFNIFHMFQATWWV